MISARPSSSNPRWTRHACWVLLGVLAACGQTTTSGPASDAVVDVVQPLSDVTDDVASPVPDVPIASEVQQEDTVGPLDALADTAPDVVPDVVGPDVSDVEESVLDALVSDAADEVMDGADEGLDGVESADAVDVDEPPCGNGVLDEGEECDDGADNSDTVADACRTDCLVAHCGDGVQDTGEICDDGDLDDTDTCLRTCEVGPNLAKPQPGDVIFNELLIDPLIEPDPEGEFIEVFNLTDTPLSITSCVLRDEGTDSWVLGLEGNPAVVPASMYAMLVFVYMEGEVPAAVSPVAPVYPYRNLLLSNAGDTVILECEGQEIDRVTWDDTWPVTPGAAMALDPGWADAESNDDPANWCPATTWFEMGDQGTPMMPNLPCFPPSVDACGVGLGAADVYVGALFSVDIDILEPGLTDVSLGFDDSVDLQVELGHGPTGIQPIKAGWEWIPATPNDEWQNAEGIDRWTTDISLDELGVVALAGRASFDGGETWLYCDASDDLDGNYSLLTELTVDVQSNPCAVVSCDDPPELKCLPDGVTTVQPLLLDGLCLIEEGAALCDYDVVEIDCGLSGQVCVADVGCAGSAAAPASAGEVVVTELMVKPQASVVPTGQWIELTNTMEHPLTLEGCVLTAGDVWSATVDAPLVIGSQESRVLGRLDVPAANGGVSLDWAWGNSLEFPSSAGDVKLACGDVEIDVVAYDEQGGWPLQFGASLSLSPFRTDAAHNDLADNWCHGAEPYGAGDLGSPGMANPACPGDIDPVEACHVANGASETIAAGTSLVAGVWLKEEGLTELTSLTDVSEEIRAEAGVAPMGTEPADTGWSFVPAEPAVLWEMGFSEPQMHYDGYAATFTAPSPGTWQLVFRVSADGGNTWTLCDLTDDGIFTVADATVLTTTESPCHPLPCVAAEGPVCVDSAVTLQQGDAVCSVDSDEAVCTWPDTEVQFDCADLGATCEAGDCTGLPTQPGLGDVVVTEVLAIPASGESDEWIELSLSRESDKDVFDLEGCELTSGGGEGWTISGDEPGDTLIWGGSGFVLARQAGGASLESAPDLVYGDALALNNQQDTVTLRCGETVVDEVAWDIALGWPLVVGASMSLGGNLFDESENDSADAWCPGATEGGTPGSLNPLCPPVDGVLDDCRLVEPETVTLDPGILFSVVGLLFDSGTTDVTPMVDPAPGIVVEIGYGPDGSGPMDPAAGWAWAVAYPDPEWTDEEAPGQDRWAGPLVVFDAGAWDVALRASADGGESWTLCDRDGAANGYDPAEAGQLVVGEGICVPNPCVDPPEPTCDGEQLVAFEPTGTCALVGTPFEAECSYESATFDCVPYGGCVDGGCVEPPEQPAGFGDLIITELLRNSAGPPPDQGEWVEVFNPGDTAIDLRGCHLGDAQDVIGGLFPVVVAAGGHAVIAKSQDVQANGGLEPAAVLESMSLGNVTDYIGLSCPAGVIDDLAYTLGWPGSQGVSMQLDAEAAYGATPGIANNLSQFWCDGAEPYGTSDNVGTPGLPNLACDETSD